MIEVPLENAGMIIAAVAVVVIACAVALYTWWNRKVSE